MLFYWYYCIVNVLGRVENEREILLVQPKGPVEFDDVEAFPLIGDGIIRGYHHAWSTRK
jgi:hypothetical protein